MAARLRDDQRGADLVEYVVLAALFALVLGIAMSGLPGTVNKNFSATTSDLVVPVSPID